MGNITQHIKSLRYCINNFFDYLRNALFGHVEQYTEVEKTMCDFKSAWTKAGRIKNMNKLNKILENMKYDDFKQSIDVLLCEFVVQRLRSNEKQVALLALDTARIIAFRGGQLSQDIQSNAFYQIFNQSELLLAVRQFVEKIQFSQLIKCEDCEGMNVIEIYFMMMKYKELDDSIRWICMKILKKQFENFGIKILKILKNNQTKEQKTIIIINDLMRVEGYLFGMKCILEHYSNKTTARELGLHQTLTIFLNLDIDEDDKSDQQSQEISLKSAFNKMQTQLFSVLGHFSSGNSAIHLMLSSQPNNILEKISEKLEYFSSFMQRTSTEQDYKTEQNLCVSILSLLENLLKNDHQHIMKFTENTRNIENVIKLSENINNTNIIGEQIEKQSYKHESADIRWRSLRIIEIIADDGWIFQESKQNLGIKMGKVSCESICNSGGGKGLENERIEYGGLDVLHSMTGEAINRDECYLNANWKSWLEKLIETEEEQGSFEEIDNILYATQDEPGRRISSKANQLKESIQKWWKYEQETEYEEQDIDQMWFRYCFKS